MQREKMASDPDYRINQQDSQKNWCRQNPDYWRKYRSRCMGAHAQPFLMLSST